MEKYIQAYFENEDKAERARTYLLVHEATEIEVSSLPNGFNNQGVDAEINDINNAFIPLLPLNVSGPAIGGTYVGLAIPELTFSSSFEESNMRYVLSAKVKDSEYNDIVQELKSQGAKVNEADEAK